MATSLERIEDDVKEMIGNVIDEALEPAFKRLDDKIGTLYDMANLLERVAKMEQFIANLGPLARLSERLTKCEELLMHHDLDIETNCTNIEALFEQIRQDAEPPAETAALSLYGGEQ